MIIIPTYNERKNIQTLVGRIRAVLPDTPVLFVDDSSPDGTSEEIKNIQSSDSNIHLIIRSGKAGFASAYLEGLRFVLEKFDPKFIITMDADLSHPPEKLPELIDIALEGDVAVGSRYVSGGRIENWELRRRLLSKLGNLYAHVLTRLPIKDITGGFMAIPIEKIKQIDLNTIHNRGYAFLMEMKVRLAELGSNFVEIPITFEERKEGESKLARSIVIEGIKYPGLVSVHRQIHQNYPAWLLFFISFGIYVATLPHKIFFGDSAEFIASAETLGIPHPPGYPAYVLFAKLFTFFPFDTIEFRVGLFSAVCASLSLVVFYFIFFRISKNAFIAFTSSLILGFSALFWSQAIMAKVYMPLLLITLLIVLLFIKYWEQGNSKYLVAAAFLFGLGSGFHQIVILFSPIFLLVIAIHLRRVPDALSRRYRYKPLFLSIFLFLLGASIYLYLPVRAGMAGNFYNFSSIFNATDPKNSFSDFMNYLFRTDYADYGGQFNVKDKIDFFTAFLYNLWQQFYWLLVIALFGLIKMWQVGRKFLVVTSGIFLINIFAIILVRSSKWNLENEFLYSFYYLPAYSMVAIWIGMGLLGLYELASRKTEHKKLQALSLVMLLFPVVLFSKNVETQNLSDFSFSDEYTRQVLINLPPEALLLTHFAGGNTDTIGFGLAFQQVVKKIRPDVTILTPLDIHPEADKEAVAMVYGLKDPKNARYHLVNYVLKAENYRNRPIYTTYLVDDLPKEVSWTSVSNGLVYKFYEKPEDVKELPSLIELDYNEDLNILMSDLFGRDLISQYDYAQASYWVRQNNLHKSEDYFIDSINYDYRIGGIDQKAYMFYRKRNLSP